MVALHYLSACGSLAAWLVFYGLQHLAGKSFAASATFVIK